MPDTVTTEAYWSILTGDFEPYDDKDQGAIRLAQLMTGKSIEQSTILTPLDDGNYHIFDDSIRIEVRK